MIHRHLDRVFRRLSIASFIFLVLVTGVSAIFVHQVSPLRDPAFQPNSANAGTVVRALEGVSEENWVQAAVILSGLLALSFTLVLWQMGRERQIAPLPMLGLAMWALLYYVFLFYLFGQWIID
jgi:CBS-domain-containing membrane protein